MMLAMARSASGLPPGRLASFTTRVTLPSPTSMLPTTCQTVGALLSKSNKLHSHTTNTDIVGCGDFMEDKYQLSLKPTCNTGKVWTTCTLLNGKANGNKALVSEEVSVKLGEAGENIKHSMEPTGTLLTMTITTLNPKEWPTEFPFLNEQFFENMGHHQDTSDFWTSFTWDSFVSSIPTGTGIVVIPPYGWSSTPTPTTSTTSSKKYSTSSSSTSSESKTTSTLTTATSSVSLTSTSSQTQSLSDSITSSLSTSTNSLVLTPTSANAVDITTSEITVYPTAHINTKSGGSSSLSVGAKAGIGAGSAAGFLAIASTIAYVLLKKHQKRKQSSGSSTAATVCSSSLTSSRRRRNSLNITEHIHGMSTPNNNASNTNNNANSDRTSVAVPLLEGAERVGPHSEGHAQECPYEGHCSVHDPLRTTIQHHPRPFGMWGSRRTRSGQLVAELQANEHHGNGNYDSAVGRSQIPVGDMSGGKGGQTAVGNVGGAVELDAGGSSTPSSATCTTSEPGLERQGQPPRRIYCPRPRPTLPQHWQTQMELRSMEVPQELPTYAPIYSRTEPPRQSDPGNYYDAVDTPYSLWRQQSTAELDSTPVNVQQSRSDADE